jgi:hypothetical protein
MATPVEWVILALALIWVVCINIALRQRYKDSDRPTLPTNATAVS